MYFEIEGTSCRLLGSIHRWPNGNVGSALPTWVWEAYLWSEELYLECDTSSAPQAGLIADGSSLENRLPPSVWSGLNAAYLGADIKKLKPWAALIHLQFIGQSLCEGVEPQFAKRAQEESKPIRYLETMEEFESLMDSVPDRQYADVLVRALAGLDGLRQALREMRPAWLTRRLEVVEALLPRTLIGLPGVAQVILDARNRAWLSKIIAGLPSTRRRLMVVGAGHLPRATGLLALLAQQGHQVRLIS